MRELRGVSDIQPFSKENFQYAKGVAILLVLISHIGNFSGKTWFTPLGGIGVAIFLFCSGYGVMTSYHRKGVAGYWKNKFISIWIPFALVETVSGIIHRYALTDVAMELVFLKVLFANGWYMQYLAVCYLLFYVGVKLLPNNISRFALWGIAAILSFVCCGNLQGEQALSFISGLALAELHYRKEFNFKKSQIFAGGGTALLVASVLFIIRQLPWTREQTAYLYTFLNIFFKGGFAAAIIIVVSVWKPAKRTVLWIGSISYSLYLVHGYFLFIVEKNLAGNFYASSAVMLGVSFVLAAILNEMVKNLKKRKE